MAPVHTIDAKKLIEAVKERRAIYDFNDKDYGNRHVLDRLWEEIGEQLEVSTHDSRTKWFNLRIALARELREGKKDQFRRKKNRKKWYLLDDMSFLFDYMAIFQNPDEVKNPNKLTRYHHQHLLANPLVNEAINSMNSHYNLPNDINDELCIKEEIMDDQMDQEMLEPHITIEEPEKSRPVRIMPAINPSQIVSAPSIVNAPHIVTASPMVSAPQMVNASPIVSAPQMVNQNPSGLLLNNIPTFTLVRTFPNPDGTFNHSAHPLQNPIPPVQNQVNNLPVESQIVQNQNINQKDSSLSSKDSSSIILDSQGEVVDPPKPTAEGEIDPNLTFFQGLLPELNKMSQKKQRLFKSNVYNYLTKLLDLEEDEKLNKILDDKTKSNVYNYLTKALDK